MASTWDMMFFLALLPGMFVVRCCGKASGLGMVRQLRCRPCERRDPYAVNLLFCGGVSCFSPTKAGGYGSLRSQGRRVRRLRAAHSLLPSPAQRSGGVGGGGSVGGRG